MNYQAVLDALESDLERAPADRLSGANDSALGTVIIALQEAQALTPRAHSGDLLTLLSVARGVVREWSHTFTPAGAILAAYFAEEDRLSQQ
jgi:hypothetical protein